MKTYFVSAIIVLGFLAPAAHAASLYNDVGIATTGNLQGIENEIADMQAQVTAIEHQLATAGGIYNPTIVTSSTIASALPQALGTGAAPTFGGLTITTTSPILVPNIQGFWYFPTPSQLALGTVCGITAGVTEAGNCVNDIYTFGSTLGSSTPIFAGPYAYTQTNQVNFNIQNELVYFLGSGNGTSFTFTLATGTAWTVNDCNSNGKRQALQLQNFALYGTSATSTNGGVTLLTVGGSNGACDTQIDNLTLKLAYKGLVVATNTYMLNFSNSTVEQTQVALTQQAFSNSGEGNAYSNDKFLDVAGVSAGGTGNPAACIFLDTNSSPSTLFNGGSQDNCWPQQNGGNNVTDLQVHHENTLSTTDATTTFVNIAASANSTFNDFGSNYTNDGTASSTSPAAFITIGSGAVYNSFGSYPQIGGAATSVPAFATGLGNINVCYITNDNGAVRNLIGGNGVLSQNSGINNACFSSNAGSWQTGWYITSGNLLENKNGGNVDVINTATNNWSFGGATLPTSTLQTDGSLGAIPLVVSANQTYAANTSPEVFKTNGNYSTDTLPTIASSQGMSLTITETGASTTDVLASTTAPDFILVGTVTSTNFSINPGGFATFVNNGSNWVVTNKLQAWKTPSISGAIVGLGCDTATTSVDLWVRSSTTPFNVLPTQPGINTPGVTWTSFLSGAGIVTTQACSDATVTPTASTATFDVQ